MRDRSRAAGWTAPALVLGSLAAGVPDAAADDVPPAPPATEGATDRPPCGEPPPADGDVLVVCSTTRVEPSRGGVLYHEHAARRPRSGGAIGVSAMTTLTPRMRRDGLELQLGAVRDRRREFRVLVRPLRGVLDGGDVDRGLEVALGAGMIAGRFHLGLEGNAVFGIAFEQEKLAFGVALVGQYELLATDRLALTATARLGADIFEHELPDGGTETRGDPLASVALGVTWFQVVAR